MPWVFGEKKKFLGENTEGEVPLYLNYYSGCSHGCLYCYSLCFAQRMARISTPQGLRRVTYKDWKSPGLEPGWQGIQQELAFNKTRKEVFLQGTSDSYAPHVNPKVTRKILDWLKDYDYAVLVLTKNPSVLRDRDFFTAYRANCRVGFTITVPEKYEAIRRQIEPHSPSTKERIEALEKLYAAGCQTTISMEPLLPNLDVADVLELMDKVRPLIYNVCFVGKLTKSSVPPQYREAKPWKGINKEGAFDEYYENLFRELLPAIRRRYSIATHTFKFCLKHGIKGAEVNYNRLPKEYQRTITGKKEKVRRNEKKEENEF